MIVMGFRLGLRGVCREILQGIHTGGFFRQFIGFCGVEQETRRSQDFVMIFRDLWGFCLGLGFRGA